MKPQYTRQMKQKRWNSQKLIGSCNNQYNTMAGSAINFIKFCYEKSNVQKVGDANKHSCAHHSFNNGQHLPVLFGLSSLASFFV